MDDSSEIDLSSMVHVKVPATTANLGPGFDCIGVALDIWNDLIVERSNCFQIVIEGEGEGSLPTDEKNLVVVGVKAAFERSGVEMPSLKYTCINRIPFARGLGSSSAAIVGGLIAGLALAHKELPVSGAEELLNLACGIEGHPDNAAPAIYGGMQIGIRTGLGNVNLDRWYTTRVPTPPDLQFVLFVPDGILTTHEARELLPQVVDRQAAIFNSSRTALLVSAMMSGNMEDLEFAMQDQLHQPHRAKIVPHLMPVIEAAKAAGAHGACLSGAGPTVLAITSGAKGDIVTQSRQERTERAVATAMKSAAEKVGVTGRILITSASPKGAHVHSITKESL